MVTTRTGRIWREAIVRHLKAAEVVRLLPEDVVAGLARESRTVHARKGQVLFLSGDPAGVFVLLHGRVGIFARPTPGTEMEIFRRCRNELFGELSLWFDKHVNEARALERSLAVRIPAEGFRSALAKSQPAMLALVALLAKRLAVAEARLGEIGVHSVKERLLRVFARLTAGARAADSRGDLLPDRLTQEELASLVGASRVAVSHALGTLKRTGDITVSGRRIIVRRPPRSPV